MARVRIQPGADAAVAFENVGLWMPKSRRRAGGGRRHRLRRMAGEVQRTRRWILRQATAHVDPGEVIAVIGPRTSGRENVLRLAAGTLLPDVGRVVRNQPVVPVLSLAKCLDRRLTTRQNIYLLGGLLGMSPDQVTEEFESIVEAAGVRTMLDKHLGAAVPAIRQRLAWQVAMSTHARAFAIEQVIGSGSAMVQDQAWAQMRERSAGGVTFLVVSDDERRLREHCDRAWYVEDGALEELDVSAALARVRMARRRGKDDDVLEQDEAPEDDRDRYDGIDG